MSRLNDIRILAEGLQFPEGPAFAPGGSLWAVELKGGALLEWKDGEVSRHQVGGAPNGIAIDANGGIWFCDTMLNAIRLYNPETFETKTIVDNIDGKPLNKPNDLAFDSKGNLVFTCPGDSRNEPLGYACVLTKDGRVKKITDGKYFPNGLVFTGNGNKLVLAETYKYRLWMGDWNADECEWTNESIWCNTGGPNGPGGPDGMAFDTEGNLYVAVYGTGRLKMVNPGGIVIEEIVVPGSNPTNCAFDPSGRLGLVITEAEKGLLLSMDIKQQGLPLFKANDDALKLLNSTLNS